jgi:FkbM family methyltransferase
VFEYSQQRRIDLTTSCRDADAIPKVDGAGEIAERDGTRVQVMHNGVVVEEGCYYGDWMTEIIRRLHGHHEPQEEAAFHLLVQRLLEDPPAAPTMVELGSFWAYYSLWFARALPGARLVLVEPDLANLEVGRRNLALNGVSGRFVAAAVGLPDGGEAEIESESDATVRTVRLVGVDGLMAREGIDRIDLLLCDAQGAELAMLEGARGALRAGRIRFLVLSTHHASISGDPRMHERCLRALDDLGAHVVVEHTLSESFSGDGLVVASMDPRDRDLRLALSHARAQDSLFGELEHIAPPRLSICIPTHHGRGVLLEQALESIAPQVTSAVEVVVSDNASRDGTDEMIERFRARHPHVTLVYGRNERDVRLANIMRVVERAGGDWCWLFGSDDLMAADGIATVLRAIERHPNVSGIGLAKVNFSHDMSVLLGQDVAAFSPAASAETVYEGFDAIVYELAFQHAYLGTNVVRRSRWLSAAKRAGPDLVQRHPDWPQIVVLADMARRDPAWAWLPAVLVKARAGRPYLVADDAAEANLALVHVALVDGLRDVWPRVAGRGTPLHRALLRKSYRVAASPDVVRNIKLQRGQTLARDVALLRSFARAFGSLPEFRRHCLPLLLEPAAAGRARRRLRPPPPPMTPLEPHEIATAVSATLPAAMRPRATATVRCVVSNRGRRVLRRADPNPVALGFRWFEAQTGKPVLEVDRRQLERPLRPGASVTLDARVNAPWEPGAYELRISLVQELVMWFDDVDPANGARFSVTLEPPGA